jgi:predicted metal-dependent hydrolase
MSIPIDRLTRTRRKTIAIVVERDGTLTVRAPLRMSETHIRAFVETHADWIAKNQVKVRAAALPAPKQYAEGETFLYLGQSYPLSIVAHQRQSLTFDGVSFLLAKSALPKAEQAFVRWYKAQAALFFLERVLVLARQHGFHYQKIRISSARTRWGSCSSKGTLSFTYRLVLAPPEVVDYVIIHELVHTKVKNHSRTFWLQVEKILPECREYVRWLKKNGRYLM